MPDQKLKVFSWAFYDFANTIFSAIVLTSYFPLYLTQISGKNIFLGLVTTGSMILAGAAVPFFGALSDQTGKTKSYLLRTTLVCIFFMSLLSLTQNIILLISFFFVTCFFYHASLVFYNSLLPVCAPPERQGFVSGLGTGLGYLGVVMVLPLAQWIDTVFGQQWVFLVSGLLFLAASIPLFLFVPERSVKNPVSFHFRLWKEEYRKIRDLLKRLWGKPAALLFLGGNFFVVDAINSMIFWFLVFAREVFHPGQEALIRLLIGVNAAAFFYGLLSGRLTDRFGALKTLILASALLALSLGGLAYSQSFLGFTLTALSGGAFAIAAVWTAGRKALLEFAPLEETGTYFGLYGLTTKISVLGSLMFSIIADTAGFRPALWALVFPSGIGTGLLLFSYFLKNQEGTLKRSL